MEAVDSSSGSLLARTYGWLALALLVGTLAPVVLIMNGTPVVSNLAYLVLMIASYAIMWATYRTQSFGLKVAGLLLFGGVMGASLSGILMAYGLDTVAPAFLASTVDFTTMSIIGSVAKRSFAHLGGQLFAATIGLVVTEAVMWILAVLHIITISPLMMMIISGITVVVFSLYTIYDTRRLEQQSEEGMVSNSVAIEGAMSLLLDFINIFISLLNIIGLLNNRN